jgi:hypothetical protein
VIDLTPDYISAGEEGEERINIEVVQIWIDPNHPDCHRDPALRTYLAKLSERGIVSLIRLNDRDAFSLLPPALSPDSQCHEVHSCTQEKQHTAAETAAALGGEFHMKVTL